MITIPIESVRGPAGVMQIGINLSLLDLIQNTLATILVILTVAAMVISGLMTWIFTARVMKPLATMTRVATQITNADDLSRRIPQESPMNDEVGKLVTAFNQTLERLERLFSSQQRFLGDVSPDLCSNLNGDQRQYRPDPAHGQSG